ncbi:TetR/AcrR family transcriptional regulator [Streptomyces sp. NBC_00249]|uniref:TetR/AcrR family transcriptional regulator n=1 Tax=Streptomyces sp. NBC_00249 TaxID=2975690 RepID=UPI0022534E81|nr:TetR/AcrR family transcriptional regulator [Streptomyces sp. NBC_00249]MCX5193497.1 TetR/AcrR family transcriptional regulator [Streptomyces sp. NBC_00249]
MGAASPHLPDALDEFGIPIIPEPTDAAQRRRQAIIDAALAEFLAEGYSAASMDAITTRSGVSKATIYKHFGNKERLFLAVVGGVLPRTQSALASAGTTVTEAAGAPGLRDVLVGLITDWGRLLLSPDIMSLRRLVIGEIDRFPQLGQLWYSVTYDMNNRPLVEAFTVLHDRGVLDVPDPGLAVQQLIAATIGVPQLVRTFTPDCVVGEAELTRVVTSGVDLFLARYATGA